MSLFGGIGLGTFPFANPFTPVGFTTAARVLDRYFERGGTYIDTAPTYAFGDVERFLGEYLAKRPRDSYAVSSSCGYVRDGDGGFRISGAPEDVARDAEESLERLRLDYFDVYISHIPDPATPKELTAAALCELKGRGLARRIGVSNVSAADLQEYLGGGPMDVVQNRCSFLNRALDTELVAVCERNEIDIVAYQVIERGLLTTSGPQRLNENADDLRHRKPEFRSDRVAAVRSLLMKHLAPIASSVGMSMEAVAVLWVVGQPAVGLAQIGATSVMQVDALPLGVPALSERTISALERAYEQITAEVQALGARSLRHFMGLDTYDVSQGSASGR